MQCYPVADWDSNIFPLALAVMFSSLARVWAHVWFTKVQAGDDLSLSECKHEVQKLPKHARYVHSHRDWVKRKSEPPLALSFKWEVEVVIECIHSSSLIYTCTITADEYLLLWQLVSKWKLLALSQHVSLCCVIVHCAHQKGGCGCLRGSPSVCGCVCACCAVQSSPVQLLQAALTQMVLSDTTYQRHCLGKASSRR